MKRILWVLFWIVAAGSVLADFVGEAGEVHHVWEYRAAYAIFGFTGCALIVYVSKWVGKAWLQRETDYYVPFQAPEPARPEGAEGGENV